MRRVLFICTGNYYRSRFAEAVFNHAATARNLNIRAFSRGLATWLVYGEALISANTVEALAKMQIPLTHTGERPVQLSEEDLNSADLVIALKEKEHRPMMETQFPAWSDKIVYWHVHDIDFAEPALALPEIHEKVSLLLETLTIKNMEEMAKNA